MTQDMREKEKENETIELSEEQMEEVSGGANHWDWWNVGRRNGKCDRFGNLKTDSEEQQG